MSDAEDLRCPVCRARFRQSRECTRCGADLKPLMLLAMRSHNLRRQACEALQMGNIERARGLAARAQELRATPEGRRLCVLLESGL